MPTSSPQAIQLSAYNLARSSSESQRIFVKAQGGRIEGRTPTHFICLLDVSGSMDADSRLRNCIDSLKYIVRFLTADDRFSLITFSDHAETKASLVQMDAAGQASVLHTLNQIRTLGSTNLSSALERLTGILRAGADGYGTLKQGVLLLTDGYVNMGLTDEGGLTGMVSGFMTEFPRATLTAVGYGTDHNRDLLNAMTTRAAGTYNIVRNREDVASVFGAVMGSMVSCIGLNLRVLAPRGTTLREERHTEDVEESLTAIALGDVYAETTTSLCLTMPAGLMELTHIRMQVYNVAANAAYAAPIDIVPATVEIEREAAVYMIRQDIAGLLRLIGHTMISDISSLLQKANLYDTDLDRMITTFGETTPILRVLKEEIREAIAALERIRDRPAYEASVDMTIMAQHARYLSQGSGTRATSGGVVLSQAVTEDPFMSPLSRQVSGGAAATVSARTYHETDDPAFDTAHLAPVPLLRTPSRQTAGGLAAPPLLPPRPHFGLRRSVAMGGAPPSPIPEADEEVFPTFSPAGTSSMSEAIMGHEAFMNMLSTIGGITAPSALSSRQVTGAGFGFVGGIQSGGVAYPLPPSFPFLPNNIPRDDTPSSRPTHT
jgi:hypothetical protein